jgi:hypothetical protein
VKIDQLPEKIKLAMATPQGHGDERDVHADGLVC